MGRSSWGTTSERNRRARGATGADWSAVGTVTRRPPSRTRRPRLAASLGEELAGDRDERARTAPGRRDEEPVGAVRLDDRELVHDVREVAAPGRADRRAGAPRDLERPPGAVERGRDRRDRFDGAFERRAVVRRGTHVEHQQHRRAAPGLVLAHHQMPAARGRPPVDVAQVVAGRVLAQRHEVAARLDPGAHRGVVAVEVETADVGRRRDLVHLRVDDDLLRAEHAPARRRRARTDR